jgi:hypothetical protein
LYGSKIARVLPGLPSEYPTEIMGVIEAYATGDLQDGKFAGDEQSLGLFDAQGIQVIDGGDAIVPSKEPAQMGVGESEGFQRGLDGLILGGLFLEEKADLMREPGDRCRGRNAGRGIAFAEDSVEDFKEQGIAGETEGGIF